MGRFTVGRRWLSVVAGASLLVTTAASGAAGVTGGQQATTTSPDDPTVSADVVSEIAERGRADFWVHFAPRPDLSPMHEIADWEERGRAVHEVLARTAEDSQAELRADLDAAGVSYTPYLITNAVLVHAGDEATVAAAADLPGVDAIYPTRTYEAPEPIPSELTDVGPAAVEWGITDIEADQVWSNLGVLGEDIVVANLDTGVQFDHPALVGQYRGNNGDGTFSHDYNWFDGTGGAFPDMPVDYDGHGTHTAGTMVGDDHGDNQIGVAPGARWIAAGTDWTDASLYAAGEWFLAPTDLSGSNPNPALRPHIVNNSWGIPNLPDPFMPDILEAWEASGIFGVWAAGNEGPGCETLRNPPLLEVTYATGAYGSDRQIAVFSSRGPGENGETKPNIAAPGDGVRSAVPGNAYAVFSGTSMAAPHVAGSIALMWSAAPALVGDIQGTKDLLDQTAGDAPDLQCGGVPEDNNVYGEGRLDAYDLVLAAPIGEVGFLEGTVSDAGSGDPLPAARVSMEGPADRTLVTGADGTYRARVLAGDYDVTATKFGWLPETAPASVPDEGTEVVDFALEAAPTGTLSGTVTDGSGHGFPLYARVSLAGTSVATFTDPEDGSYSLEVPLDTYVQIVVDVQYPGYQQGFREAQLGGDQVEDFAVPVDAVSCLAYGYSVTSDGQTETFDDGTLPPGWTVVDHAGTGQVWTFDDPAGRGNQTGGDGGFAIVDSDFYGPDGWQDTSLVSPVYDLSGVDTPTLVFKHLHEALGNRADVDVSLDGGTTWQTLVSYGAVGGAEEVIQLPAEGDLSQVRVRFHYYDAFWAYFWQVDDVFVGERACNPDVPGGYVVGNVSSTSGDPVRGATVTSLDNPTDRAVTVDTPADQGQDDGFYWLFSHLTGTHPFEATARRMGTEVQDVAVVADGVVRADYELGAGLLVVDPEEISTQVVLGDAATEELTVTNNGDSSAEVELREVRGGFEMLRADGTRLTSAAPGEGAPVRTSDAEPSMAALSGAPAAAGEPARPQPAGPAEEPWTELTPYPLAVIDGRVVNLDGSWFTIGGTDGFEGFADVHRYDEATMAWEPVAPLPEPAWATAVGVVGGQIVVTGGWRTDGGTSAATYVYDAGGDSWSQVADNPSTVSAAGQAVVDGLVYSVGGCSTGECTPMSSTVTAYDAASDQWQQLADYPVPAAFLSCGGVDGHVVCTGGVNESAELSTSYAYDPGSDTWSEVAEAPVTWWGSSSAVANGQLLVTGGIVNGEPSNESFAYDPAGDAWTDLPRPNTPAYRGAAACGFVRVGGDVGGFMAIDTVEYLPGFDDCGEAGADVDWLILSETETVLDPGESWTVEVTTDGAVPQPGTYTAAVQVVGGMPGTDPTVPVTMEVSPPGAWGKITGTVSGESCESELSPLPGAAVTLVPLRPDAPHWSLAADSDGQYARWIDTRVGTMDITAFMEGYYPDSVRRDVPRGTTTVQDFDLLDTACEAPGPIHPVVDRLAGGNRYETAVAVSARYEPGVHTVFLATGETFPDALTGSAKAGSLGSPVLLTKPGSLVGVTADELRRLAPERVVVLGGKTAINDAVVSSVRAVTGASVERWAGGNRYETAAVVSGTYAAADVVYIASGEDFPDALAGSARAGALDVPVLLVKHGSVPSATVAELERLQPDQIRVLGGPGAVSGTVVTALGSYGDVDRVAGDNRYETAVAVSADYPTSADAFVVNGHAWPDALAAAALAGRDEAPLLLVKLDSIPSVTWAELDRLDPGRVWVLGGPGVIRETVVDQLRTLE